MVWILTKRILQVYSELSIGMEMERSLSTNSFRQFSDL